MSGRMTLKEGKTLLKEEAGVLAPTSWAAFATLHSASCSWLCSLKRTSSLKGCLVIVLDKVGEAVLVLP